MMLFVIKEVQVSRVSRTGLIKSMKAPYLRSKPFLYTKREVARATETCVIHNLGERFGRCLKPQIILNC